MPTQPAFFALSGSNLQQIVQSTNNIGTSKGSSQAYALILLMFVKC